MVTVNDASTGLQTRRSRLGKGCVGMDLQVLGGEGPVGTHLAWVRPTDGLRQAARELVPGDLLINTAGYVYYIGRSGAFLACGHLLELACYRRALLLLKREERWLFDVGEQQQGQLADVIARLARAWIEGHEQQAVYASYTVAVDAWRRTFGECPCEELFCVCLYRFPCPVCGTCYTVLGGLMPEVVERQGRCTRCAGTRPLAQL